MPVIFLIPAYLDPGSGSYILQLLLASLFGVLVVIRASWGRIVAFFRRKERTESSEQDGPQ